MAHKLKSRFKQGASEKWWVGFVLFLLCCFAFESEEMISSSNFPSIQEFDYSVATLKDEMQTDSLEALGLAFIFYKWSWCWSFKWVKYGITYTHTEFSTTSPFPQLAALPGSSFACTARGMDVNVIIFLCPFLAARDSSFTWAMQFAFLAQCFPSQLSSPSFWRTCI